MQLQLVPTLFGHFLPLFSYAPHIADNQEHNTDVQDSRNAGSVPESAHQ